MELKWVVEIQWLIKNSKIYSRIKFHKEHVLRLRDPPQIGFIRMIKYRGHRLDS